MEFILDEYPFRCVLSFEPLIEFVTNAMDSSEEAKALIPGGILEKIANAPELRGNIEDLRVLEPHQETVKALMGLVFPPAFWEAEAVGAFVPFSLEPVQVSPVFRKLLLDRNGDYRGRPKLAEREYVGSRLMRAYFHILDKCYGIKEGLDIPIVQIVPDEATGLDRYLRFKPNPAFVEVRNLGAPERLTDRQRAAILDNLTDPEVLREILPPEKFELTGLLLIQAEDVTESEMLAALDKDLIDTDTIYNRSGFERLQQRLRTLFRLPDLIAGLFAIQGDQALMLNTGCDLAHNCLFMGSRHIPISEFSGTIMDRCMREERILSVRDFSEVSTGTRLEQEIIEAGVKSYMLVPLQYQGELVGGLDLATCNPGEFGATEAMLAEQVQPMFAMALKRGLDDVNNEIQGVIKERCTAVHPSVEWRFQKAVVSHLERLRSGEPSELEPIVFRDVYPLYSASDIRGSSDARNRAIQEDLGEHLDLALDVANSALEERPLSVLEELAHRITDQLERIQMGLSASDERNVIHFLQNELEPLFSLLRDFGPRVADAIDAYEKSLDPKVRTIYRRRKDFEESVAYFNERLSAYLDEAETEAQATFPHYFDKHKTDGVDYTIYVGASMVEDDTFNGIYVRNLRLWQLMVACALAWHAEQIKPILKVPLNATHLILVSHNPLSIRFRFDEKRFDVDGAYDTSQEIIRSRIDKAMVKGGKERLTQPGKIAVVYSRPEEAEEILHHISFLQAKGYLIDGVAHLDLDDLPDIQGLKALRVTVDLESVALAGIAGGKWDEEAVA